MTDGPSKVSLEFSDHCMGLDTRLDEAHLGVTKAPVEHPGHFELALSNKTSTYPTNKASTPSPEILT